METEAMMCRMVRHCFLVQHTGTFTLDADAPLRLCASKQDNNKHGCSGAQATIVLNQTENGGNQHAKCLWGRKADTAD